MPTELDLVELATLSMQAGRLSMNAPFVSDLTVALELCQGQETARGNFAGPCSIVWKGDTALPEVKQAMEAGV